MREPAAIAQQRDARGATWVPVVEAEQVVDSLKKRGIPVEYVLFADEGHGWRKTSNRIRSAVAVTRWFEKYLKAGG
jgi:dipeptidyl aminopeptidase/acylaminoacyl peptidase